LKAILQEGKIDIDTVTVTTLRNICGSFFYTYYHCKLIHN